MNRFGLTCVAILVALGADSARSESGPSTQPALASAPATRPAVVTAQPMRRVEHKLSVDLEGLTPEIVRVFENLSKAYTSAPTYSDTFVNRLVLDLSRDNQPIKQTVVNPGSIQRQQPNKLAIKTTTIGLYDNGTSVVVFDAPAKTYRQGLAPDQLNKLVGMNKDIDQVLSFSPHIGLMITADPAGVLLGGYDSIRKMPDETIAASELGFRQAFTCHVFELRNKTIVTTLKIDKETCLLRAVSTDLTQYLMRQLMDPSVGKLGVNLLVHQVRMDVDIVEVQTGLTLPPDTFIFRPQQDYNQLPLEMPETKKPGLTEDDLQKIINEAKTPSRGK